MTAIVVQSSEHSTRGASSAYRWMACPGSVRETAKFANIVNKGSEPAALGTAAHEIASRCLLESKDPSDFESSTVIVEPGYSFDVDEDMIDAVSVYVDYVRELAARPGAVLSVERSFDLKGYDTRLWGRNDACVYDPATATLYVVDYKHGAGKWVDATNNPQLQYYALGALLAESLPVKSIVCAIVQPRCHGEPIREWRTEPMALLDFAADLMAAVSRTDDPDAPLVPGDEQCLFCAAAAICPARRAEAYKTVGAVFDAAGNMTIDDPQSVSENYLPIVLERAERINDWVRAVRAMAHDLAEQGRPPAGYKLVDKQARRKWIVEDGDVYTRLLSAGVAPKDAYTHKILSPAQAEKALGKKTFAEKFGRDAVASVSSGTNLVREQDGREPVAPKRSPEAMFR